MFVCLYVHAVSPLGVEGELVLFAGLLDPGAEGALLEGLEESLFGCVVLLGCLLGVVVRAGLGSFDPQARCQLEGTENSPLTHTTTQQHNTTHNNTTTQHTTQLNTTQQTAGGHRKLAVNTHNNTTQHNSQLEGTENSPLTHTTTQHNITLNKTHVLMSLVSHGMIFATSPHPPLFFYLYLAPP